MPQQSCRVLSSFGRVPEFVWSVRSFHRATLEVAFPKLRTRGGSGRLRRKSEGSWYKLAQAVSSTRAPCC